MSDLSAQSYQAWLNQLKADIRTAQQRSVLAVNQELIKLYWRIGKDILQRQQDQGWGAKVIEQLAQGPCKLNCVNAHILKSSKKEKYYEQLRSR